MAQHFGCVRWVYNWALSKQIEACKDGKGLLRNSEISKEIPLLKKQEETTWLSNVNAQSIQQALHHLDEAYTRFFKGKSDMPRFKSKRGKNSFSVPQRVKISFDNETIQLPKIGKIKIILHRSFEGNIKTVTISKTTTNKYFASVLVETTHNITPKVMPDQASTIGIDVGIKTFATLSTGEKIPNPRYLKQSQKKLKFLQYKYEKKAKGGKNREKARQLVAKKHEKIRNQRSDFLHKLSIRIVRENQTVCVETLNVAGMTKNHRVAQAISDSSWSMFTTMLEYKCAWAGKNIIYIGRFEPSSRLCTCGKVNKSLTLADRVWRCECGLEHDRDILAARNIKMIALKQYIVGQGLPEVTLGESAPLGATLSQEAPYKLGAIHGTRKHKVKTNGGIRDQADQEKESSRNF